VNGASFNAGDSVLFAKGCTFSETLTVPSSGSAGNLLTFGAYGSGAAPVLDGANYSITATDKDYIGITGLELSGSAVAGLYVAESSGWVVSGNTIEDNGTEAGDGQGILFQGKSDGTDNCNSNTITQNVIGTVVSSTTTSNTRGGILIRGGSSNVISYNTIATTNARAIRVSSYNDVGGSPAGSGNQIIHNTITQSEDGIDVANVTSGTVAYNLIHTSKGKGIGVNYGFTGSVYYNVIYGLSRSTDAAHYNGIDLYDAGDSVAVYNNTVKGVYGYQLTIEVGTPFYSGSSNAIVKNNILDASAGGNNAGALQNLTATGTYSTNVYRAGATCLNKKGVTTYANLALWQAAVSDANSIEADPLFLSASDFRLQAGSPAINAGVDVSLTTDYWGYPVYGLPDIGAVESQGAAAALRFPLARFVSTTTGNVIRFDNRH
jgi:hypothetical protein